MIGGRRRSACVTRAGWAAPNRRPAKPPQRALKGLKVKQQKTQAAQFRRSALHCQAMPRFSPSVVSRALVETCLRFAVQQGTGWVRHQRHKHRRHAVPLSDEEFAQLSRFFAADTLRNVRIAHLPVLENPKLVGVLRLLGAGDTLDFSAASGVTYDDLILISKSRSG